MNITSILILRSSYGPDRVILHTDITSAQWPFNGTQDFYADVAREHGEEFCETNFPNIPVKLKET